jgi:predicted nucleotidyltransferase
MDRFEPRDAPVLVRAAREDIGLSQAGLARKAGVHQSHIAEIEAGRRPVSAAMLERLLQAADYRPSLAVAAKAQTVRTLARKHGYGDVRVFGSVASGRDHHHSDVDLLVKPVGRHRAFSLGAFVADVERELGFHVDVVVEREGVPVPDEIRAMAVPL